MHTIGVSAFIAAPAREGRGSGAGAHRTGSGSGWPRWAAMNGTLRAVVHPGSSSHQTCVSRSTKPPVRIVSLVYGPHCSPDAPYRTYQAWQASMSSADMADYPLGDTYRVRACLTDRCAPRLQRHGRSSTSARRAHHRRPNQRGPRRRPPAARCVMVPTTPFTAPAPRNRRAACSSSCP